MTTPVPPLLASTWAARGIDASDLRPNEDGTLGASGRGLKERPTLASVFEAPASLDPEPSPEVFELGRELGRGGMGVVYLADQPSMRREVALKCLTQPTERAVSALLGEAWITGALEHPNIVPIHSVVEVNGAPAIAMKRVEGISWDALIDEPGRRPHGANDEPERWHLSVFLQVCQGVQFAHRRGVLHLDLKPENVMVGAFGEVYVVDWGMAAGIGDHPPWLASAADTRGVTGTPAYMAPEIAAGDGPRFGPWTDVYLLGATLHHAVVGRPRHAGPTLMAVLYEALVSEPPDYGGAVHPELAAILDRACHVDPSARYQSVEALREAVEGYLRHGEANRMVEEARRTLRALRESGADDTAAAELETRCRFAIEQARRIWPESPGAEETQRDLFEVLLGAAIDRQDVAAAARLRSELSEVPAHLVDALRALDRGVEEQRARVGRLEAIEGEFDPGRALAQRRALFVTLGIIWFVMNLTLGYLDRSAILPIGYEVLVGQSLLFVAGFGVFAVLRRGTFFSNRLNTHLQGMLVLTAIASELLFVVSWIASIPPATTVALSPVVYLCGFGALAITVDRRLAIGAIIQLAGLLGAALPASAWVYEIVGITGLLSLWTIGRWPAPGRPTVPLSRRTS